MENSLATPCVCSTTGKGVRFCLSRRWKDFEDCVVVHVAERVKANLIVTHDAKGFDLASTEVVSPAQALDNTWSLGFDLRSAIDRDGL